MNLIGYARVSTDGQNPDAQEDALEAAGWCSSTAPAANSPVAWNYDAAFDFLRADDVLVVTKLDRLGRSVRNLIDLSDALQARGVGLRVLDQGIDTTTPVGRMFFHVLAAIAEFEAALISERTRDGLAAARARGRKGGRRPKLTPAKLAAARKMYDAREHMVAEIAAIVGVARSTLYRALEPMSPED